MSDLKELMDDLAADKVTHLRIDLVAAGRRGTVRRNWLRDNGTTLMLAAAAALVAIALLLPLTLAAPVVPATRPTGLPDRFYGIPDTVRTVEESPIGRASMVLSDDQLRFFVVSADGTRYRRLPGVDSEQRLALSADGRRVAWVTWVEDVDAKSLYAVHVVDLADGVDRQYAIGLPATGGVAPHDQITQLLWAGDVVYAGTVYLDQPWWRTVHGEPDDMFATVGGCPLSSAADAAGRLVAWTGTKIVVNDPARPCPTGGAKTYGQPQLQASPAGDAVVTGNVEVVDERVGLQIYGAGARRVQMTEDARGVTPLAWTSAGIVAEVGLSSDEQLVLVNPATRAVRTISRSLGAHASPVAVAADLVGDGSPIRAPRPDFLPPVERGGFTAFLEDDGRPVGLAAALALTLAAGGLYLRRRRNA